MVGVILAAGRGSRLGRLTVECPKALVCMPDGEPFIGLLIRQLREAGISAIYVVCGYMASKVVREVEGRYPGCCHFVNQSTAVGTAADGLLAVAEHIKEDFVLMHCDH